jgi:hypothetical protein
MAAILCKPISACIEFVCTAPCKLCAGGCKLCSDGLSGLCTNPLSAFVFATWFTQIPLAVASALEIPGLFNGCKGSRWLMGMLATAIAHMFTSIYLASRVANKTDEKLRDKHTAWERISYLLCHDPWVAIYLLVVVFDVAWLVIGSGWSINGSLYDCDVDSNVAIVLGFGWFYLVLGPAVLSCNLCCACCDKGDYAGDDADFAVQDAEKEARKSSKKDNNTNSYTGGGEAYNASDIERPPEPKQPPRTYSTEGIPIPDDGRNAPVVEAEVVIEESTTLPPAMPPPKNDGFNAQQAKIKAEEAATKAAASAQATASKAVKSAKGWFNKKTKGSEAPERKATVF